MNKGINVVDIDQWFSLFVATVSILRVLYSRKIEVDIRLSWSCSGNPYPLKTKYYIILWRLYLLGSRDGSYRSSWGFHRLETTICWTAHRSPFPGEQNYLTVLVLFCFFLSLSHRHSSHFALPPPPPHPLFSYCLNWFCFFPFSCWLRSLIA